MRRSLRVAANPVTGGDSFYGLGWSVEFGRHGLTWGHAGAFSVGARTVVALFPNANIGIVILCNAYPTGVPEGLTDSFADLAFDGKIGKDWVKPWDAIYDSLFGPATAAAKALYATPPQPSTAAMPPAAYVGRYTNAYVGDADVSAQGDLLTLSVGPQGARSYPLRYFDRDLFLHFPDRETPDKPYAARFSIGSDAKASQVKIESLDDVGLGTLERVSP
jgi:hypothetical protein